MSELELLRQEVEQLRRENNGLKEKLALRKSQCVRERSGIGPQQMEVETYRAQIRKHEPQAPILRLHDELLKAEQQCAIYGNALEDARGNFVNMKRLYSELNKILDGCSA
uniref:Uncharacterized protein n=1 Tax=Trypanosoma congolense (strain IL3000) TaxID=1068625 RepID=G0V0A2_TRYCI|nr:conserved hypothetical protein [Trypanosoma congolense IL3000]